MPEQKPSLTNHNIDLQSFIDWVIEDPNSRMFELRVDPHLHPSTPIQVWVYNYNMSVGQYVKSVSEINLEHVRQVELEKRIKELENASNRS